VPLTELVHECSYRVLDEDDTPYSVRVYARRFGNLWEAWLEFKDPSESTVFRTERETTQLSLGDAIYWAEGLEPVFLEGAFERARALVRP
jgi:hypothetical protein